MPQSKPTLNLSDWTEENDKDVQYLYAHLKKQGFEFSRNGKPQKNRIIFWALRDLVRRIREEEKSK